MFSEEEINKINRKARFLPEVDEDTTPCLEIGGAQVYAYFSTTGRLVVSVDLSTVDERFVERRELPGGRVATTVPIEISVGDETVWSAD